MRRILRVAGLWHLNTSPLGKNVPKNAVLLAELSVCHLLCVPMDDSRQREKIKVTVRTRSVGHYTLRILFFKGRTHLTQAQQHMAFLAIEIVYHHAFMLFYLKESSYYRWFSKAMKSG